ncbi:hypothetical protein B0H11DRAFT_2240012 [Mycena galericulata]|nr:hypothetical protein B0H11DRAFT_2240012 [Mycena galericulata]
MAQADFISTLPVELFNRIFHIMVKDDGPNDDKGQALAVVASQVCHLWREITVGSRLLWSTIKVEVTKPAFSLYGVQEHLRRAGTVPLTVVYDTDDISQYWHPTLQLPVDDELEALEILVSACTQWKSAELNLTSWHYFTLGGVTGRLPLLESLSISIDEHPWMKLEHRPTDFAPFGLAPRLTDVAVRSLTGLDRGLPLPYGQLLTFASCWENNLVQYPIPSLHSAQLLQTLELPRRMPLGGPGQTIALANLNTLWIHGSELLFWATFPMLKKLVVEIPYLDFGDVQAFEDFMVRNPRTEIEHLELVTILDGENIGQLDMILTALPTVRTLIASLEDGWHMLLPELSVVNGLCIGPELTYIVLDLQGGEFYPEMARDLAQMVHSRIDPGKACRALETFAVLGHVEKDNQVIDEWLKTLGCDDCAIDREIDNNTGLHAHRVWL